MTKQLHYQNLQYVVVKNQYLSKKQEASEILNNLGLTRPLNKIEVISCFRIIN